MLTLTASAKLPSLRRRGIVDRVFTFFGHPINGVELTPTGIRLIGRGKKEVPFENLTGVTFDTYLWFLGSYRLSFANRTSITIVGFDKNEAEAFSHATTKAWRRHIQRWMNGRRAEILAASTAIQRLADPDRYPAASAISPLLRTCAELGIPSYIPAGFLRNDDVEALKVIIGFLRDCKGIRKRAVDQFVKDELVRAKPLLDTIEKNPLTPEQSLAVVTDEDATLVLAGAGSGKTSVIVAKAAHLVTHRFRLSSEILLMSFASKAAEEMADRVKERTGLPVDARTFHSLGKAIITAAEGKTPKLAPHAAEKDGDTKYKLLIKEIIGRLIVDNETFGELMRTWFSEFFAPYKSLWDFTCLSEYLHYVRTYELRSLKKDRVRSFEECEIANWLFLNGIEYEYEPKYTPDVSAPGRRAYQPDFRLTDSGVYIEHFGLSKGVGPDGKIRLETAPYIDRDRYLADREWKKQVHAKHGTVMLETFSYEKAEGRLIECLAERIAPYATPKPIPAEAMFDQLRKAGAIDSFTNLVCTFLKHFKGNALTIEDCRRKIDDPDMRSRNEAFLRVFEMVYAEYQKTLGDHIDFEDMVSRATEYVREARYASPYRHLLVDEFQDISLGRAKLLKALLDQHADARLFAVGDDWQAIYRFAGSDLAIMREFASVYGGTFAGDRGIHAQVDLGRTFRCVDKVALPAKQFVRKNTLQLDKEVAPAGTTDEVAIRVTYAQSGAELAALKATLSRLQERAATAGVTAKVTILARYKKLKPINLALLNKDYPNLKLDTLTVHSSKGLEADHIIVVGMNSGSMGFPSEFVDDPVLMMVLPAKEAYKNAEERRLFYVALTRAKQSVDLIAESERPSSFVDEMVSEEEYGVEVVGEIPGPPGGCPRCGGRMIRKPTKDGEGYRFVCEHGSYCGYSAPACPKCEVDAPARHPDHPAHLVCSCGARHPICSKCGDGWLLPRPKINPTFLGCSHYPYCDGKSNRGHRR